MGGGGGVLTRCEPFRGEINSLAVGSLDGVLVGTRVGPWVGSAVGLSVVGQGTGARVGRSVGARDGARLAVGESVGRCVGDSDGLSVVGLAVLTVTTPCVVKGSSDGAKVRSMPSTPICC